MLLLLLCLVSDIHLVFQFNRCKYLYVQLCHFSDVNFSQLQHQIDYVIYFMPIELLMTKIIGSDWIM